MTTNGHATTSTHRNGGNGSSNCLLVYSLPFFPGVAYSQCHGSTLSPHHFLLRHDTMTRSPPALTPPQQGLIPHDQYRLEEACILRLLQLLQQALTPRVSPHDVKKDISRHHTYPLVLSSIPVCILEAYVMLHERWDLSTRLYQPSKLKLKIHFT
jgi:hypothetical protein